MLIISFCACVCHFALASLHLAAAVQTFRNRVIAPRLHCLFAILKIPVSILGAIASWMIATEMVNDMNNAMKAVYGSVAKTSTVGFLPLPSLFAAIIACTYAIALLVIFTSPDVKRYYDGLRNGTG